MQNTFSAVFYALNGRAHGPGLSAANEFDITPRKSLSSKEARKIEGDLIDAIQTATKNCFKTARPVYLSLSAGYDSTAILAALVSQGRNDFQSFTYGLIDPPKWSDVAIARETARRLNCAHAIWPMDRYPADVIQRENARLFQFRANRCGELGAWLYFRDAVAPNIRGRPLFVFGDECFGWNDGKLNNNNDLLHSLGLVTTTQAIEPFLIPDAISSVRDAYANELTRIVQRAAHLEDLHDKKDYLYFHERLQNVILPWRQQFSACFGDISLPLLDKEILSLVGKLPISERRGKRLMKRAVKKAFPVAFSFRRAIRSGAAELPIFSAWPEHYSRSQLLEACETTGLKPAFLDEIEHRVAVQKRPRSSKLLREIKAMAKASLKDTLITSVARSRLPPPYTAPPLDLILSRLQIWLLGVLNTKIASELSARELRETPSR